jgi:ribosome-binding protein aMBF1 (putative translation factor)
MHTRRRVKGTDAVFGLRQLSKVEFARFSLSEHPHTPRLLRALGLAIRERREQRHLSRAELAAQTRVTAERIGALERGSSDPDYELLLALADALGVGVGALFTRAEALAQEDRRTGP